MKPSLFISAALLLAPLLGGCATAVHHTSSSLRLQAQDIHLRTEARRLLHHAGVQVQEGDAPLPLLQLSESEVRNIESLLADGSVGSYEITYALTYQYGDKPAEQITRVQVVDYSENFYRASGKQQQSMVESLRRSALSQMIVSLQLH